MVRNVARLIKNGADSTHLPETVLPEDHVRGNTVLSVVHEDDHTIGVHGLSGEELVVLEVSDHLLGKGTGGGLEGGKTSLGVLVTGVSLGLESSLGLLHVRLEVGEVRLGETRQTISACLSSEYHL